VRASCCDSNRRAPRGRRPWAITTDWASVLGFLLRDHSVRVVVDPLVVRLAKLFRLSRRIASVLLLGGLVFLPLVGWGPFGLGLGARAALAGPA
jgi:hypothetical protein